MAKNIAKAVIFDLDDTLYDRNAVQIEFAIGLVDSFDYTVIGKDLGIRKPDPEIFRHTASMLNISTSECLYIGDSYTLDVIGSKDAGMLACWYNPKKVQPPELNDVRADFTIEALPEILSILCADKDFSTNSD